MTDTQCSLMVCSYLFSIQKMACTRCKVYDSMLCKLCLLLAKDISFHPMMKILNNNGHSLCGTSCFFPCVNYFISFVANLLLVHLEGHTWDKLWMCSQRNNLDNSSEIYYCLVSQICCPLFLTYKLKEMVECFAYMCTKAYKAKLQFSGSISSLNNFFSCLFTAAFDLSIQMASLKVSSELS